MQGERFLPLISEDNKLLTNHVRELNISPLDAFRLTCVIEALPIEWRKFLKTCNHSVMEPFNLQNQVQLYYNNNIQLYYIIIPSPACSLCGEADESLEHLFVTCHYTKKFWAEVIKRMGNLDIEMEPLSNKHIMKV